MIGTEAAGGDSPARMRRPHGVWGKGPDQDAHCDDTVLVYPDRPPKLQEILAHCMN
jgi:hypothetical protein